MGEKDKSAADYWIEGTGWNRRSLAEFLPVNWLLRLYSVVLQSWPGIEDKITWMGTENGGFTVRSAYTVLTAEQLEGQCMERFFDRIWKVVAPERVRVFLWLVGNQVIITNEERLRRHMGDTDVCPVCRGATESIIHVLRDCPAMAGIWIRLVPEREQRHFFATTLLEWLFDNLSMKSDSRGEKWPTMFAMALWWGWKWRCGNVFGERGHCRDRLRFVKDVAEEVVQAHLKVKRGGPTGDRVERLISWTKPEEGWVTVNTDGASRGNPGLATAGGALRNETGEWLGGFALNIGYCSAPLAELWGGFTMVSI